MSATEKTSVMRKQVTGGFRNAVAAVIAHQARVVREMPAPSQTLEKKRRAAALDALSDYIGNLDVGDQRLVTLATCTLSRGKGIGTYELGVQQVQLVNHVGWHGSSLESGPLLDELVRAAADDAAAYWRSRTKELTEATARAEKVQTKLERLDTQNVELKRETDELKAALDEAVKQREQAQEQVAFLRGLIVTDEPEPNGDSGRAKAKPAPAPRRKRHDNEPNIYETLNRKGEPTGGFQVGYTEDGRQRWKTVDSLKEAVALRDRLRAEGKVKPQGYGVGLPG